MKKMFSKFFVPIFLLIGLTTSIGYTFIEINNSQILEQDNSNQNTESKIILPTTLSEDVEDFTMSVDMNQQTVSFDVIFKNNDYDGASIRSFYYEQEIIDGTATSTYFHTPFENSTTTVKDRHASNTTSYSEIYDYYDNGSLNPGILSGNAGARLNVEYEKNGSYTSVCLVPVEFYLDNHKIPFTVDDSKTFLDVNNDKTYAQIHLSFQTLLDDIKLEEINLKSHSDDNLNQEIYSIENDANALFQGDNNINFQLLSKYHYKDLYVEFSFYDIDMGQYIWQSDITNDLDFVSGKINEGLKAWVIILLVIIILLIILAIIFIGLIIRQMRERKELERQQDQAYYDENYEDGMY